MRILHAVRGYPPGLAGDPELPEETERHVQALARALAIAGHTIVVVAGTRRSSHAPRTAPAPVEETRDGGSVRVLRILRPDREAAHWQKSFSHSAGERFRAILRSEKPDVVHVHHWQRLSRDLVWIAAQERVPAVVSLHDAWTSCLVTSRVRPDTLAACDAVLGPVPCLACARGLPPRTPWVPLEAQFMALAEHRRDLERELELARAVIVPTRAHGEALARGLAREIRLELPHEAGRNDGDRRGLAAVVLAPVLAPVLVRGLAPGHAAVPVRTPRLVPPDEFGKLVLGSWGPLSPLEGTDLLLEALRDPRLSGRVALRCAGRTASARFETRLRDLARGLDVHFHGAIDEADLEPHPAGAVHAFVGAMRSRDPRDCVLDESRALGLPSVLPRHPPLVERTDESRGSLFFEPGDPRDLARVLARLLDEPGLLTSLARRVPTPSASDPLRDLFPIYERAIAAGAPAVSTAGDAWFAARMRTFAEEEWDRRLAETSDADLGFEDGPGTDS